MIVLTDNGCRDTSIQTIRVNPQIVADFSSDTAGCSPLSVRFRDQSTGAATYQWFFGDGGGNGLRDPRHIYVNPTLQDTTFTATLVATSTYNCADTFSAPIRVFAKPISDFSTDVNDGCHPVDVSFTYSGRGADSCRWVFGDGNTDGGCFNTTHTYTNLLSLAPVNYRPRLITITDKGCRDTLERNVQVRPQVIADFTVDTVGCSPFAVTFRSQSFGAGSLSWSFGDGGIRNGMIAPHTYTNTGSVDSIFTARLIAESVYNCRDTAERNIPVSPPPIPDFTVTPQSQKFPASTITLTNQTNPGNWSFVWDFGDSVTTPLRDPGTHTYGTWGDFIVQLKASSTNCSDSVSRIVNIIVPDPIADFRDSAAGCEPLEVQFFSESEYARTFEWDFGDGNTSNAEHPNHIYNSEGDYTVTLRVRGYGPNLQDVEVKANYIQVYKSPRAGFFANKDEVFIPADPIVFSNTSFDADSYKWLFGNGDSSNVESPTYFYKEEGEFQVTLIASSGEGCVDTFLLPTLVKGTLEGSLKVPNAFTPNKNSAGEGRVNPLAGRGELNDVFYAKVNGVVKYELNIFNKWGELLFVSEDINYGWNGYYRGELCQQDVYVWKVKAELVDGREIVKVGDLMLLR